MATKHTCVWLTSKPCTFPATYCGKPTRWTIERDDDGNKYRKYSHLCDEHREAARLLPKDEDE